MKNRHILVFSILVCFINTDLIAQIKQVGSGSYTSSLPEGESGPSSFSNLPNYPVTSKPCDPKVVAGFAKPIQTNDWWTSFIWNASASAYYNWDNHSWPSYAHPLAFKACRYGLKIKYPDKSKVFAYNDDPQGAYRYEMGQEDLTVSVDGMDLTNNTPTKVKDYSDWSFTAYWDDNKGKTLTATMGHGLLYSYFTKTGGNIIIRFNGSPQIFYSGGNIIGVSVNGHSYALCAPTGSTWNTSLKYSFDENESPSGSSSIVSKVAYSSDLNGKDYLSIALLPDNTKPTIEKFAQHAFVFVDSTEVKWNYSEENAQLLTQYVFHTSVKEGNEKSTMYALYRHQWLHMNTFSTAFTYVSPRGLMKVNEGNSFSISLKNFGIIPALPYSNNYDGRLETLIEDEKKQVGLFGANSDSYFGSINICREAELAELANQVNNLSALNIFLDKVQSSLTEWLSASDGEPLFYFDAKWNTFIGFPASYASNTNLNDHHFHYGYFIKAAAILAKYRPNWAKDDTFGKLVKMVIKDVANWDRNDKMFPFLRFYDPYAGHSWAGGSSGGWGGYYPWGADQEASGESMNFASAVYLWGLNTNDNELRDLGLFLFLNEKEAIEQYWFDIDKSVFPSGFNHVSGTRLWSSGMDKVAYSDAYSKQAEYIAGINILPAFATSLYLGINPEYVNENYNEVITRNGGEHNVLKDLFCFYQSFYDSNEAINYYESNISGMSDYSTQPISTAFLYHWLYSINVLGRPDTTISANYSSFAVFQNGYDYSYVVNNVGEERIVKFSNGKSFLVPADTLILLNDSYLTNVSDPLSNGDLMVYPNPGKGNFRTTISKADAEVSLYDNLGICILEKNIQSGQGINFYINKTGVYYLVTRTKANRYSQKIIVL